MAQNEQKIDDLSPEMFEVVGGRFDESDKLSKKQVSFWKEVFYRFTHRRFLA
jgi:oligopeptide transport system permease protein